MTHRITAAIAVVGALVGAAGFAVGTSQNFAAAAAETAAPVADATPVTAGAVQMAESSADQRKELEGIIHNYLLANPEVITEALTELQRRRDAAEQAAQVKIIEDSAASIFASQNQVVLGNPDGKVTLVEFFDYNCTYCRHAEADIKKLIADDPDLRLVLKQFPVLGPGSLEAAKVAVALRLTAPDKYAPFHDAMLEEPGQTNGDKALAVAVSVGVDADTLKAKLDSDEVKTAIRESFDLASKLSLTGTPSFVTHQEVIAGAVGYDALKTKINALAAACATAKGC
jgi:protein-disulfide isomerase